MRRLKKYNGEISMAVENYKGYLVLSGVKWIEDKNTITITCYPKKKYIC